MGYYSSQDPQPSKRIRCHRGRGTGLLQHAPDRADRRQWLPLAGQPDRPDARRLRELRGDHAGTGEV